MLITINFEKDMSMTHASWSGSSSHSASSASLQYDANVEGACVNYAESSQSIMSNWPEYPLIFSETAGKMSWFGNMAANSATQSSVMFCVGGNLLS